MGTRIQVNTKNKGQPRLPFIDSDPCRYAWIRDYF